MHPARTSIPIRIWLAVALALLAWPAAGAQRYVSASVDAEGHLQVTTGDGRSVIIAKEAEQVGFEQIAINADGSAVGWVGVRRNCCTSYPVPTRLFVDVAGEQRLFRGIDRPVWKWRFMDSGRHVAFHQAPIHGGGGAHYELRDIASGALVAEWAPAVGPNNLALENQTPPAWVTELRREAHDSRNDRRTQ